MKRSLLAVLALALALGLRSASAQTQSPITIGLAMSLTGGLAPNGKSALLAMQIWAENTNAKGGLLGRPVKLVYYDDQSNPAQIPGIYTKLLDVDKVDLVISSYGTNMIAPAMPVIIQHGRTFLGLFGLDVNSKFNYPNYFSIVPLGGPHPRQSFSQPFFAIAAGMEPRPVRLALVGADAEFPKNALDGARELAKENKLSVVYDRSYPPSTADFTPIVRAIQAARPDLVFVASYPPDTVGMLRAARETGLKTRLFGGGMVGLQSTAIKVQLGEMLNGIVDYDYWLPWGGFAGSQAMTSFMKQYQDRAGAAGIDALGYYLPPFAFSEMQVLADVVEGTKSLADDKLAEYLRSHQFETIVGPIKFGPNGEWTDARVLEVQFQGVQGHDLAQFRGPKTEVILYPAEHKTGTLRAPYEDAQH